MSLVTNRKSGRKFAQFRANGDLKQMRRVRQRDDYCEFQVGPKRKRKRRALFVCCAQHKQMMLDNLLGYDQFGTSWIINIQSDVNDNAVIKLP